MSVKNACALLRGIHIVRAAIKSRTITEMKCWMVKMVPIQTMLNALSILCRGLESLRGFDLNAQMEPKHIPTDLGVCFLFGHSLTQSVGSLIMYVLVASAPGINSS